jgi:hypothetical protein
MWAHGMFIRLFAHTSSHSYLDLEKRQHYVAVQHQRSGRASGTGYSSGIETTQT